MGILQKVRKRFKRKPKPKPSPKTSPASTSGIRNIGGGVGVDPSGQFVSIADPLTKVTKGALRRRSTPSRAAPTPSPTPSPKPTAQVTPTTPVSRALPTPLSQQLSLREVAPPIQAEPPPQKFFILDRGVRVPIDIREKPFRERKAMLLEAGVPKSEVGIEAFFIKGQRLPEEQSFLSPGGVLERAEKVGAFGLRAGEVVSKGVERVAGFGTPKGLEPFKFERVPGFKIPVRRQAAESFIGTTFLFGAVAPFTPTTAQAARALPPPKPSKPIKVIDVGKAEESVFGGLTKAETTQVFKVSTGEFGIARGTTKVAQLPGGKQVAFTRVRGRVATEKLGFDFPTGQLRPMTKEAFRGQQLVLVQPAKEGLFGFRGVGRVARGTDVIGFKGMGFGKQQGEIAQAISGTVSKRADVLGATTIRKGVAPLETFTFKKGDLISFAPKVRRFKGFKPPKPAKPGVSEPPMKIIEAPQIIKPERVVSKEAIAGISTGQVTRAAFGTTPSRLATGQLGVQTSALIFGQQFKPQTTTVFDVAPKIGEGIKVATPTATQQPRITFGFRSTPTQRPPITTTRLVEEPLLGKPIPPVVMPPIVPTQPNFRFPPFIPLPPAIGTLRPRKVTRRQPRTFMRTPSFAALQLGYTAPRPREGLEITGLFERPVIKRKKKRKKK